MTAENIYTYKSMNSKVFDALNTDNDLNRKTNDIIVVRKIF